MTTIDEAIKIIRKVQAENTISVVRYIDLEDVLELLQSKTDAEEYRTPKKIEITDSFHTFDDGTQEPHKEYQCPTCKRILSIIGTHGYMRGHFGAWYCEYCGQALDWPEVTE